MENNRNRRLVTNRPETKVYGTNTKSITHWMPLPAPPKEDT